MSCVASCLSAHSQNHVPVIATESYGAKPENFLLKTFSPKQIGLGPGVPETRTQNWLGRFLREFGSSMAANSASIKGKR